MNVIIKSIDKNSIAEELGILPGDEILTVNGEKFTDILEYRFLIAGDYTEIEIKSGEEITLYEIEKDENEDLGIEFETPLIDKPRSCRNKCIFCFIDQLPKGLRKPLYFKDDDTRLSFLTGNYVTLTNMSDKELDRIVKIRLSPINISVHTTDDELRVFMLKNPNAAGITDKIKKLVDGGIEINCQIVLVKNVNDKANLEKTLRELSGFYPGLKSISVVPIGLTAHRDGLYKAEPFLKEDSREVIKTVEKYQQEFLKKYSTRLVYLADEFYIKAQLPLPAPEEYEGFGQLENGVGMMSLFTAEAFEALKEKKDGVKAGAKTVVTGECAYEYIKKIADECEKLYPQLKLKVIKAENKLFGGYVSVAGLLCGRDIVDAVKPYDAGDKVIVSVSSLRAERDMFLDDMTPGEAEKEIGTRLEFAENDGADFVKRLLY